jgi:hypothetical protein
MSSPQRLGLFRIQQKRIITIGFPFCTLALKSASLLPTSAKSVYPSSNSNSTPYAPLSGCTTVVLVTLWGLATVLLARTNLNCGNDRVAIRVPPPALFRHLRQRSYNDHGSATVIANAIRQFARTISLLVHIATVGGVIGTIVPNAVRA